LVALYCDASALAKLVIDEPESDALTAFIQGENPFGTTIDMVSSVISQVEVARAAKRLGPAVHEKVASVLAAVTVISVRHGIVQISSHLPPENLRTLDAIHVASALSSAHDMISYDHRLNSAAALAGVKVYSPGMVTSQ
jgi:uncharacterized protein